MAIVTIPAASRRISDAGEIKAFLADHGINYETWPLEDRVDPAAPAEDILAAYKPEIDILKEQGGFVTADVIDVYPDTPNLEGICAKFKDEHLHTDDEVRFVLEGEGIFDLRAADERWIRAVVERGDLLIVPKNHYHRFFLTEKKHIRCVRLFKDSSGWTPHYR